MIHTPDDGAQRTYRDIWIQPMYEYFSFDIKACLAAHVLLTKAPRVLDDEVYEIPFGSYANERIEIRNMMGVSIENFPLIYMYIHNVIL